MTFWKVRPRMKRDLTLAKIKNTNFPSLYDRFILGKSLSQKEYECLLAIAICFINADDANVQQFGYRIIVEYCNQTSDYAPLYDISINKGLYPVSKFIEQHYIADRQRNFFTEWNNAFLEQYAAGEVYRSEQQYMLVNFFDDKKSDTVSVIAPTSYGKSELILSAVREYAGKKICVLTSTKALLIQTKKRIQRVSKDLFSKIVVHPEMYNPNDQSCLAVLTQERLLRIFKKDPFLAFDCIVIDEAHEILDDDTRSHTLANVIIVAQNRNPNVAFKFLTPFLADGENLKIRYTSYDVKEFKVSEYIKTEKYFLYDIRNQKGLYLYDQFLNKYLAVSESTTFGFEEDFVKSFSASKNIVYLNKPTDIERFSLALADVLPEVESELIATACENISDYLQPQYNLLTCLRKGIIYHHGSVPDAIRIYIEDLYKKEAAIKFVVTSSTLLSGVNLPAERMFILDNRRGRAKLSHDAFKNLVGRVCRFNEIFNQSYGTLQRLEPCVFLVFGQYFSKNANGEKFLQDVAKVELKYQDNVENVLLSQTKIDSSNEEELRQASEFIENYENGIIENYQERYTETDIGKACIMNGISEIDVFSYELIMQQQFNVYQSANVKVNDTDQLLDLISTLFVQYIPNDGKEILKRLENKEARNFYAMMLSWRMENKSYAEMIGLFVGYWRQLYQRDKDTVIYVGKWGDIQHSGSKAKHYTKLENKNRTQIVNLAIVRIKEEQDFIDNVLIKFVEVLHDLNLLDDVFYAKIKYGTDDEATICLLKNGLSLSSAILLLKKYRSHLKIDIQESTVVFDNTLIDEMQQANENQIIIYEIQSCI